MNEIIPYSSLFYLRRGGNLVQRIFINSENKICSSFLKEQYTDLCIKEISEETVEYLMTLSELDLHIPYILHLINQE